MSWISMADFSLFLSSLLTFEANTKISRANASNWLGEKIVKGGGEKEQQVDGGRREGYLVVSFVRWCACTHRWRGTNDRATQRFNRRINSVLVETDAVELACTSREAIRKARFAFQGTSPTPNTLEEAQAVPWSATPSVISESFRGNDRFSTRQPALSLLLTSV